FTFVRYLFASANLPGSRDLMTSMVFPGESHEHIHIQQKRPTVGVSISFTSREVMSPLFVRITRKPSSPVSIVKLSNFVKPDVDRITPASTTPSPKTWLNQLKWIVSMDNGTPRRRSLARTPRPRRSSSLKR